MKITVYLFKKLRGDVQALVDKYPNTAGGSISLSEIVRASLRLFVSSGEIRDEVFIEARSRGENYRKGLVKKL